MLPLLLAVVALADGPASDPPPLDAVVLLQVGASTCAGAFVDDAGTVATAYHCVARGGRPHVLTRDGREARGRVVATHPRTDLAVVSVPELAGGPFLPIREEPPAPGERVRALGHPFGSSELGGFLAGTLRWSVSDGVVSTVGAHAVQVSAPVNPGNSGGPVVDANGRLVGVVSRKLQGDGIGFAARADALVALIEDPNGYPFLGGTIGVEALVSSLSSGDGGVALGGRAEVSVRDRIVLTMSYAYPLSARWNAVRFGEVVWNGADLAVGVRQRFFRGPLTAHVDLHAGVGTVDRLAGRADLRLDRDAGFAPIVGGAVGVASTTLDVAAVGVDCDEGRCWSPRLQLVWSWPGTLWVF